MRAALLSTLFARSCAVSSKLDLALEACANLDADACSDRLVSVVDADPSAHFYLGLLEHQRSTPNYDAALRHYECVVSFQGEVIGEWLCAELC